MKPIGARTILIICLVCLTTAVLIYTRRARAAGGDLDASFNSCGVGAYYFPDTIVLQLDGKILIAGLFTSYNGVSRNGIARLNTDGTLDTSLC